YSAVRTSGYDGLTGALHAFTNLAAVATGTDLTVLRNARDSAIHYEVDTFRDLGAFMQAVANSSSASVGLKTAAQGVLTALSNLVISKTADSRHSYGVAIYLPALGSGLGFNYGSQFAAFNAASGWGTFLDHIISTSAPLAIGADWAENNDVAANAAE